MNDTKVEIHSDSFSVEGLSLKFQKVAASVNVCYVQDISAGLNKTKSYFEYCADGNRVVTKYGSHIYPGYTIDAFVSVSSLDSNPASASNADVVSGNFAILCVSAETYTVITFKNHIVVENKQAPEALVEERGHVIAMCSGTNNCQQSKCHGDECKPRAASTESSMAPNKATVVTQADGQHIEISNRISTEQQDDNSDVDDCVADYTEPVRKTASESTSAGSPAKAAQIVAEVKAGVRVGN
ncbi:hypothetical protein CDD83_5372 [Cordyceps sp. RAO-2017]|nr:hypothetical protein CDD83_5372 [Cordyceps sp. RAO-2017]